MPKGYMGVKRYINKAWSNSKDRERAEKPGNHHLWMDTT
jgi:hypothetical protein